MAKLSSYRRIFKQDFDPEYDSLITSLAQSVNSSFEELYDSLNNKLTLKDNVSCTIAEFKVSVDTTGVPVNKTQFKLNNDQQNVEGLIVINASGATDASLLPTAGVFVSFIRNENLLIIQNIKGLQPNKPYKIKVIALG